MDLIANNSIQNALCVITDTSGNLFTGTIAGLAVKLKINNGADVDITSTSTVTYDSSQKGFFLGIATSILASITSTSQYEITISGSNISNYWLNGLIQIPEYKTLIPTPSTNIDPSLISYDFTTGTIYLAGIYASITSGKIVTIKNHSTGQCIYNKAGGNNTITVTNTSTACVIVPSAVGMIHCNDVLSVQVDV